MIRYTRTSLRMDSDLLRRLKEYAARQGTTLTRVLEEAARQLLARRPDSPAVQKRLVLPSYSGQGLQSGVDLDDTTALFDRMDRRDASL